jgi:hypothetical protein
MEKNKELIVSLADLGIVSDIPKDESNKRKLLLKIITRFTSVLRGVCNGDYRDPIPAKENQFRLKYHIAERLNQLEEILSHNIPDFNHKDYASKLLKAMTEMRGRELPGFGSTRLLLSTVSEELDCWRSQIEDTVIETFDFYRNISESLSEKLTGQVSLHDTAELYFTSNRSIFTVIVIVPVAEQRNYNLSQHKLRDAKGYY